MEESLPGQVLKFADKYEMFDAGQPLICAVSGGADSLCLLHVLNELDINELFCVHVNHGIRGKSADADEEYVKKICGKLNIPCIVKKADVPAFAKKNRLSLEDAARRLRYEALYEAAREISQEHEILIGEAASSKKGSQKKVLNTGVELPKIAVAHNLEDNAETLLMHLFRGSGINGLAGIAPVKKLSIGENDSAGLTLVRPLLNTSRKQIEEYLNSKGIAWRTDETNADTAYTRNAVRNVLFPYIREHINENASEHIAVAAGDTLELKTYIEKETEKALKKCESKDGSISLSALKKHDIFIQKEVLKKAAEKYSPERAQIEELTELISSTNGSKAVYLKNGVIAERRYDKLYFMEHDKMQERSREADKKPHKKPGNTLKVIKTKQRETEKKIKQTAQVKMTHYAGFSCPTVKQTPQKCHLPQELRLNSGYMTLRQEKEQQKKPWQMKVLFPAKEPA